MSVVLSSIAFGILRTNRVPSDIFRHFPTFLTVFHGFLHFPPFTAHFCGKRHDFFAYAALQLKIVTLTTKMCGERRKEEKAVKNRQKCRKMSGDTRLVRKMRKAMLDNTTIIFQQEKGNTFTL